MGNKITLTASDGFKLGGYRAEPQGKPKGGLVVIQEIFGVNHHIRAMCDRFAAVGYTSTAPQVFDRIQPNFESGYSPDEIAHARTLIPKVDWAKMLLDVASAIDNVKGAGKVGIVGYCMGGTVAFLSAGKLDGLSASVGYYGGQIAIGFPNPNGVLPWARTSHSRRRMVSSSADIARSRRARPRAASS